MKKLILSLTAILAFANANSDVNKTKPLIIELKSYQKSIVTTKDGKRVTKWVKPTKVVPGTIIKYVTSIKNNSNNDIKDAVVTSNIDKNLIFIPQSIESNLKYKVTFSVDGKNYAPAKNLKVVGKDGKKHLAKPSDYKAVKFDILNIPAQSKNTISYQAKVK